MAEKNCMKTRREQTLEAEARPGQKGEEKRRGGLEEGEGGGKEEGKENLHI